MNSNLRISRGMATVWIVVISISATLVLIGLIIFTWWGVVKIKELSKDNHSNNSKTEESETSNQSATQKTPTEDPDQIALSFIKSIFDTFPGSSVDLTKANGYLVSNLQSQVSSVKESYWDLHGYIHSGPCKVSVETLDESESSATVQISTIWGECFEEEELDPYYQYKMINNEGEWKISEIIQLNPTPEDGEIVPRDF